MFMGDNILRKYIGSEGDEIGSPIRTLLFTFLFFYRTVGQNSWGPLCWGEALT